MGRRAKVIALDQKRVGLANQELSSSRQLILEKFDLAQLADGFGLLRLWMRHVRTLVSAIIKR